MEQQQQGSIVYKASIPAIISEADILIGYRIAETRQYFRVLDFSALFGSTGNTAQPPPIARWLKRDCCLTAEEAVQKFLVRLEARERELTAKIEGAARVRARIIRGAVLEGTRVAQIVGDVICCGAGKIDSVLATQKIDAVANSLGINVGESFKTIIRRKYDEQGFITVRDFASAVLQSTPV